METKHTPGPWYVATGKNILVGPCPGKAVAVCNYDNGDVEKANARLIAAAPELLRTLQEVVRLSDRNHDAWNAAKAAISKATHVPPNA